MDVAIGPNSATGSPPVTVGTSPPTQGSRPLCMPDALLGPMSTSNMSPCPQNLDKSSANIKPRPCAYCMLAHKLRRARMRSCLSCVRQHFAMMCVL
jgi:hypothetical protein